MLINDTTLMNSHSRSALLHDSLEMMIPTGSSSTLGLLSWMSLKDLWTLQTC